MAADDRRAFLDGLFGLEGQVAVVTGGGGLIGGEFCRALARAGARVAVLGRNRANCAAVAAEIRDAGGEALAVVADVLDEAALGRARAAVRAELGRPSLLVNAVGGPASPAARLRPDGALFDEGFLAGTRAAIDLNLVGPLLAIFAFGGDLAEGPADGPNRGGGIVNVSSMAARHVSSGVMGYSAAKAGLEQLTRWLAVETGRRYGGRVRVNAISPGFTIGGANRARFFEADGSPTARTRAVLERIPVGRMGSPADLVTALLWLCSPASAYVTGQVVAVSGGHGLDTGV